MNNKYAKRFALAAAMLAVASTGAYADGVWHNINSQLKNPAFLPGWSGALTGVDQKVGECYNAPFEIYQVINNLPEGEYTLTCNAFYRFGTNDYAKENMKDGANHYAYIFLGTEKKTVEGLFDNKTEAPNDLTAAAAAFAAGDYANTVTFKHEGGDLRFGVGNLGQRDDQWTAFSNFKLTGPDGEIAIPNGDFAAGIENANNPEIWEMNNIDGKEKTVDINKDWGGRGCYRKSNASPYNWGQQVELPAGKYRFGVQSFLRHGAGNESGWYITLKGWSRVEGESAYDTYAAGKDDPKNNAFIYVTSGWDTAEDGTIIKPVSEEYALDKEFGNPNGFYKEVAIMNIFDEKMDNKDYPDNVPHSETIAEGEYGYADSGYEQYAAEYFVRNQDKYRNYVEFELTEPTKVWVGIKKDINAPKFYWNPFRDITLEQWEDDFSGIQGIGADADAPAVYYNLQGIRVINPENGIFIVKKGNDTKKVVL